MPHDTRPLGRGAAPKAQDVDLGVLDGALNFYVRAINIAVSRDLDKRLAGLEVAKGTGKITTLLLAERHPGIRPSVLAEITMRDRSAMGRVVDDMVANGLVRRETAPDDSRAQALFLTEKGAELAVTVRRVIAESRDFFSDVDDEEYRAVLALLRKIYWRIVMKGETGATP